MYQIACNPEFQFHKGTIKTFYLLQSKLYIQNFNSIKVRLKREHFRSFSTATQFQFHKGTIKTSQNAPAIHRRLDFNSIKVRLKLKHLFASFIAILFQFHKGTIKTYYYECSLSYFNISIP